MPKVPPSTGQVLPMMKPPEEVYLAMAAANMDQMGRLFEPEPEPELEKKEAPRG